jgi:hypothetical protein
LFQHYETIFIVSTQEDLPSAPAQPEILPDSSPLLQYRLRLHS